MGPRDARLGCVRLLAPQAGWALALGAGEAAPPLLQVCEVSVCHTLVAETLTPDSQKKCHFVILGSRRRRAWPGPLRRNTGPREAGWALNPSLAERPSEEQLGACAWHPRPGLSPLTAHTAPLVRATELLPDPGLRLRTGFQLVGRADPTPDTARAPGGVGPVESDWVLGLGAGLRESPHCPGEPSREPGP